MKVTYHPANVQNASIELESDIIPEWIRLCEVECGFLTEKSLEFIFMENKFQEKTRTVYNE